MIFGDANGHITQATHIGDLPVVIPTSSGKLIDFSFTNVRCVPKFKYNLLSVTQLWDEQRVDARWRDLRRLELPKTSGEHFIPFLPGLQLSTIAAISGAQVGLGARRLMPEIQATCASNVHQSLEEHHQQPKSSLKSSLKPTAPTNEEIQAALARKGTSKVLWNDEVTLSHAASRSIQQSLVGFHLVGSSSHIRDMSSNNASAFMHRRLHCSTRKLRALPDTCREVPKNLSSAVETTCKYCPLAKITMASHSGQLRTPAPSPGVLHTDLKGPFPPSIGGFRYAMFFTDEYSRFVWVVFLKTKEKAEMTLAVNQVTTAFNAKVYTPTDDQGRALPRPKVLEIRSDHESSLMSHAFQAFRVSPEQSFHHTLSPPHDHDLNPISERVNRTISEAATASAILANAPQSFWPWFIKHGVEVHNALTSSTGSSTADTNISPYQRFTSHVPKIMHLAAPGAHAVCRIPPSQTKKSGLHPHGVEGILLGTPILMNASINAFDVWAGDRLHTTPAVVVDEDTYPWRGKDAHQPLPPAPHRQPANVPLAPDPATHLPSDDTRHLMGSATSAPPNERPISSLNFLSLFSGAYYRSKGIPSALTSHGWGTVMQIDNNVERGGGYNHDLMNDSLYTSLMKHAAAGDFDTILVAFPCSTFSVARFFDASKGDPSKRRGPLPVRTKQHPNGLPEDQIEPGHAKELAESNLLLSRTVDICIAAYQSHRKTTIILENPADRSLVGTNQYSEELSNHGSLFATKYFKRLSDAIGSTNSSFCTFAFCRLKAPHQKYTTLFYTNDAASILDKLNESDFQCNHPRGTHDLAGGLKEDGTWASADASPYPDLLNAIIAEAATVARIGSKINKPVLAEPLTQMKPKALEGEINHASTPLTELVDDLHPSLPSKPISSPIAFPGFDSISNSPTPMPTQSSVAPAKPQAIQQPGNPYGYQIQDASNRASRSRAASSRLEARNLALETLPEEEPQYVGYYGSPHHATISTNVDVDAMETCVAEIIHDSTVGGDVRLDPISNWISTSLVANQLGSAKRIDHDTYHIEVNSDATYHQISLLSEALDLDKDETWKSHQQALLSAATSSPLSIFDYLPIHHALRADSAGAPSNNKEATKMGEPWPGAELKEMKNHETNGSFVRVTMNEVPKGR